MNVVAVMGRFTSDPEIKKTNSGTSVTSFTLAVQRNRKDPNGEYPTDWIDVVAWGKTAEFICNYFSKGQMIAVQGAIQTRNWEDKKGSKHKTTEVVVSDVSFCGPKTSSGKDQYKDQNAGYEPLEKAPDTFEELMSSDDLPF